VFAVDHEGVCGPAPMPRLDVGAWGLMGDQYSRSFVDGDVGGEGLPRRDWWSWPWLDDVGVVGGDVEEAAGAGGVHRERE